MSDLIGKTISHYQIVEEVGRGGMGIVYKARDVKLDRDVALKFLPGQSRPSVDELARLRAEARALAVLNHPNIATVYEFDEGDGSCFIAIEFIPGGTLRHELAQLAGQGKALSLSKVLDYGIQLGRALAHAHRRGVVHRDVKAENVMITEDGDLKVTDFGLAKLREAPFVSQPGAVAGTLATMSPEQIRGEDIDQRADLWSLGVVLFEMSTMRMPFRGEHAPALMYSIVNEEAPALRSLKPDLPASLDSAASRCLKKNRDERYHSAEELVKDLQEVQRGISGATTAPALPRRLRVQQLTFGDSVEEYPAWSPDGTRIVFCRETAGYKKLFLHNLADGSERQLTRGACDDLQPDWSRDGAGILFVRSHTANGKLEPNDIFSQYDGGDIWRLDLDSGKEYLLINDAFNPAVSPDGTFVAADASRAGPRRLWLFDSRGRNPRQITSDVSEAVTHLRPKWAPDGKSIVFQNSERVKFDIKTVDVSSGKMDWITDDMNQDVFPVWSPDGREIILSSFRSGGLNLWSIPASARFGADRAIQLTTGAGQDVHSALSPGGRRLVYANVRLNADIWRLPVEPGTGRPSGAPERLIASSREESRGAWSSDGRRVAFNSDRSGEMNIWILTIDGGSLAQVTRGGGGDFQPQWSPDDCALVFFSMRSGRPDVWRLNLDGGEMRQLTDGPSLNLNPFHSPDGRHIAYHCDAAGRLEPWVMDSNGGNQRKLADLEVMGHFMRWLPDGRSVLFRSPNPVKPGLWSASVDGSAPLFRCVPKGGSHISLSPDFRLIMDVVDHKELWITPLDGGAPYPVFRFDDPLIRIDYPLWSPDGTRVLFDYVKPSGGNLWLMDGLQ